MFTTSNNLNAAILFLHNSIQTHIFYSVKFLIYRWVRLLKNLICASRTWNNSFVLSLDCLFICTSQKWGSSLSTPQHYTNINNDQGIFSSVLLKYPMLLLLYFEYVLHQLLKYLDTSSKEALLLTQHELSKMASNALKSKWFIKSLKTYCKYIKKMVTKWSWL